MSVVLDNKATKSCYNDTSTILNEDDLEQEDHIQNDNDNDDDWIAVKPLVSEACVNLNKEIVNIVSISVEMEKILIVSREHNRLVTDDEKTKQWYGIYSAEEFYLINQQMANIEPVLDDLYPDELRPIKGFLYTYFANKIKKIEKNQESDLHDNQLCKSIIVYLNRAFHTLGKNLYVDILFNDINSDQYFEIYSEFNLKRLQNQINNIKAKLFPVHVNLNQTQDSSNQNNAQHNNSSMIGNKKQVTKSQKITKNTNIQIDTSLVNLLKQQDAEQQEQQKVLLRQQFIMNAKYLISNYHSDDTMIEDLLKLYAEYYNNLLKPLLDSREIAKSKLNKYERKLENQIKTNKLLPSQSSLDALEHLRELVNTLKEDIYGVSNDIDLFYIDYKQNLIEIYRNLLDKMKNDKEKFIDKSLGINLTGFIDILTKSRRNKIDEEITNKKLELYGLKLKLNERKKGHFVINASELDTTSNQKELNSLQREIIRIKLFMHNEEELMYKRKLNKLTRDNLDGSNKNDEFCLKESQITKFLNTSNLNELNLDEIWEMKFDDEDKDDDLVLIDYEDEPILNNHRFLVDDEDDVDFHDTYEDPITLMTEVAKEKMARQLEIEELKRKVLEIGSKKSSLRLGLNKLAEAKRSQSEVEKDIEKEAENEPNKTFIKSYNEKKQEDAIQKEMFIENRKKALQRLREYKLKNSKKSNQSADIKTINKSSNTKLIKKSCPSKGINKRNHVTKTQVKPKTKFSNKSNISSEIDLNGLEIAEKRVGMSESIEKTDLNSTNVSEFNPLMSSSTIINKATEEISQQSIPPPPPPPLPDFFTVQKILPPPPPIPNFLSSIATPTSSPPPPPPPPPAFFTETAPVPSISMADSLLKELLKPKQLKTPQPKKNDQKSNSNEFDINEIKTFKFKKSSKNHIQVKRHQQTSTNPWDCLMDEIRTNPCEKLKKVEIGNGSKHRKFSADDLDYANFQGSQLIRDLNLILNQRSQFFNDNEDDNDSSDEWDISNED